MSIAEDIVKGLEEAVAWAEGHIRVRVIQRVCKQCGRTGDIRATVYVEELPLLCGACSGDGT